MLTGMLVYIFGLSQQSNVVGGIVTFLPVCAVFSVFACAVASPKQPEPELPSYTLHRVRRSSFRLNNEA
jgi:hypothetical protein